MKMQSGGRKVKDCEAERGTWTKREAELSKTKIWKRKVNVICCICAHAEMPVAVHNPSVSQKTLSSAQRYNALEYHFATPSGGGGWGSCWSLPLPTFKPVLQRAQRSTASKSSSSIIAEPKIAPARTNARPLNTLLQHFY